MEGVRTKIRRIFECIGGPAGRLLLLLFLGEHTHSRLLQAGGDGPVPAQVSQETDWESGTVGHSEAGASADCPPKI